MDISELKQKGKSRGKIRAIDISGCHSAKVIVEMIAKALGFKIHEDNNGISAYGGNSIRISDHRTYMQTWVDNNTYIAPFRLDIVIEDEETIGTTDVRNGIDFSIDEYIYKTNCINPETARIIAFDIQNVLSGQCFANNAKGERKRLVATHPHQESQLNCNHAKKAIRLSEKELRNLISETVTTILKRTLL